VGVGLSICTDAPYAAVKGCLDQCGIVNSRTLWVVSSFDAWAVLLRKRDLYGRKRENELIGQPVPELPVADVERAQQHLQRCPRL